MLTEVKTSFGFKPHLLARASTLVPKHRNIVYLAQMNALLQKLPQTKQRELTQLKEVLTSFSQVEMVILFGSYARDEWVENIYTEKGIMYEYKSDYDILVATRYDDLSKNYEIEDAVQQQLLSPNKVKTPVSLIFHSLKHLNRALQMGNYFFRDIKQEGVVLYNKGNFTLQNPKLLTAQEAQQKAQDYFKQWFTSANDFFFQFENAFNVDKLNNAAFQLHQATEAYHTTILLVFTDYRPKDHDLKRLDLRVRNCDPRFNVFPRTTEEEEYRFDLLKRAYIDARYKMDEYTITKEELEYLAEKVNQLKGLTEALCQAKIKQIGVR